MYSNVKHVRMSNAKIKGPLLILILINVMVSVIFIISARICPTEMIFMLFRNVFRSLNSFQLSPIFMTFRRDLETEGHVMVYVTFVISVCIRPTAMIFVWFVRFSGQEGHSNNCQLRDLHV